MPGRNVICLMGPTASGKTDIAVRLAERFPLDVISVDSALVYRGMDIGTAKPDPRVLRQVPHRLIDIREPEESYSAGEFVRDATAAIEQIQRAGRLPLLVGGTMMYFRALTEGIADLPEADDAIRATLDAEAVRSGWPASACSSWRSMDPLAASRINRNDSQRIQRALEVYRTSGRSLTEWLSAASVTGKRYRFLKIALIAESRKPLCTHVSSGASNRCLMQRFRRGGAGAAGTAGPQQPGSCHARGRIPAGMGSTWNGEFDAEEAERRGALCDPPAGQAAVDLVAQRK